ncbi:MAG: tetratricopeptide repeat protein [Brevefilum sp.]|nr:tetratricopeptide repeat protein [Brevefilum sp.]
MTKSLRIHLFGPFEVSLDGSLLTNHDWQSQQTQSIAKILLSHRGKVVTSDQLIDSLWPDDTVDTARRRLHVRINQLRKGLKDKCKLVRTVHNGYIFEPDDSCWIDVEEFQRLASQGAHFQEIGQGRKAIQAYEQARQVYRGDFLAEDLYTDWTFTHRELFRERFLSLLVELSESYAQQGRYRLAIARAQQALIQDPLRETIYVRLMLYHYYSGEQAQALRVYEQCKQVLSDELNVAPMAATNRIRDQINTGSLWKSEERPLYPPPIYDGKLFEVPYALNEIPFAGRDREYAWLVSQWKNPDKQVILLEGEAGIGKSRLLDTFAEYLKSQGAQVLQIRLPITDNTPTKAVINSFGNLLTESTLSKLSPTNLSLLGELYPEIHNRYPSLPPLPALSPEAERLRLQHAVSDFAKLPEIASNLIILDDAHCLDADAVELIKLLSQSMKIVLSFRGEDTPAEHPLRIIFGEPNLSLQALSVEAIQSIINQLSGEENFSIATQISEQSGGNPLFAVTLLQHMFETGQLFVDSEGKWTAAGQLTASLPETLRETIEIRLQHLHRAQRQVLDYAAVIGGEFNFKLLKAAIQQPEEKLLTNLDALIDAALVIEPRNLAKPEFMISHDRYTEVAYETIPPIRQRLMHRDIARAIEKVYEGTLNDHFTDLADHYDMAAMTEEAGHYAALAGEQAAGKFAVSEALHYLNRALTLLPSHEIAKEAQLRLTREKVYSLQGMRQAQSEELTALEALSPHLPTKVQAEICLRRGAYEWIMENYDHEQTAIACAIQKAQSSGAKELEARAFFLLGQSDDDFDKRHQHLTFAQKLAHEAKDLALEGDILRWVGNNAFWQNRFAESIDYLTQAMAIHREVGDLRGELSALNNLGHIHKTLGDLRQAANFYKGAHEICQKINDKLAEGVILTNLGGLALDLGQFETAENTLARAAEIRADIGNEEGLAVAEYLMGTLYRQLGLYHQSTEHYETAFAINTKIDHEKQICETLNGLSALYRELGDYDHAQDLLTKSFMRNTDKNAPRHITACIEGALLSLLCGAPTEALNLGEEALALSAKLPALEAAAHKNVGHALLAVNRLPDARVHFEAADSLYQHLGQAHLAAESIAGLALIALTQQNHDQSLAAVEKILGTLHGKPLCGPDRHLWVYLTAYRVLSWAEDARAFEIIAAAHSLILERAETIPDEGLRQSYLGNVQENREISQIWMSSSQSH